MKAFHLVDEFIDQAAERALIGALFREPALYWELKDRLPDGSFVAERTLWRDLERAILEESPWPETPQGWVIAGDPTAAAERLADLHQHRLLAELLERLSGALYDSTTPQPARELAAIVEEEAARIQAAIKETSSGKLLWASDLVHEVLRDVEARYNARLASGKPVMGIPTGLPTLDNILGGLNEGLYILGGPPGMGKTTLAVQLACAATVEAPVVYVTFENSPANLVLKYIASKSATQARDAMRGWVAPSKLQAAAEDWGHVLKKLALVEGSGGLTVSQVRAKALEAMHRHRTDRCLVVVDYLQLWAKASVELRALATVRERVETLGSSLREMASRLDSPVLALASQNRAQGGYGTGKGNASLDSLKESGDLEYSSDVVLFLTPSTDKDLTTGVVPPHVALDLTVAKNRHGGTGSVTLLFKPEYGQMGELATA